MKILNKINILIISLLFGISSIFLGYASSDGVCFLGYDYCISIAYGLFIFIPLFFLSLFLCKIDDLIYKKWSRFAVFWVILSFIFQLISPINPGDLFPVYKKSISFGFSVSLIILSLFIIAYQSFKKPSNIN